MVYLDEQEAPIIFTLGDLRELRSGNYIHDYLRKYQQY